MRNYTLIILCILGISCNSRISQDTETCKVKKGRFFIDLTEEGEVWATHGINISAPNMSYRFGPLKITQMVEDGKEVSIGDTMIVFDPSEVLKAILDAESQLEIARAELEKQQAQQESRIADLEANIEIADISHKIFGIKLEQATFDADIERKTIQLNLEKAKISLNKAREEVLNQQKIHYEEIQQSKLRIRQLETNLAEAHVTLDRLNVVTPSNGIAIIRNNWSTRSKWQVGDQPWTGYPLIDLPDLSELKAVTEISEVDISKLETGQKVEIKLDAFSDDVYTGTVTTIANLAQFKNRDSQIKIFPVEILIEGGSEKFMPGMTVSCRIIVDNISDVLYVPLESIFNDETGKYVYIRSGTGFSKREIRTGRSNNDYIIIEEGLVEGDAVALSDPQAENSAAQN